MPNPGSPPSRSPMFGDSGDTRSEQLPVPIPTSPTPVHGSSLPSQVTRSRTRGPTVLVAPHLSRAGRAPGRIGFLSQPSTLRRPVATCAPDSWWSRNPRTKIAPSSPRGMAAGQMEGLDYSSPPGTTCTHSPPPPPPILGEPPQSRGDLSTRGGARSSFIPVRGSRPDHRRAATWNSPCTAAPGSAKDLHAQLEPEALRRHRAAAQLHLHAHRGPPAAPTPRDPPAAFRQSKEQSEVAARSRAVTTKNSTMEFSSGGEKEKKNKKLLLADKGAARKEPGARGRKQGCSPLQGPAIPAVPSHPAEPRLPRGDPKSFRLC